MSGDAILSLGEFLRQERERRGITIEQVASATKIGVKTLHQLEADHYADLPAKPFVRGFVNSYTRFVGIDSKETLTRFGSFIDLKAHDRPNREGGHSGYAFEKRDGDHQSRTILWVVMGSFVFAGGLAAVFIKKPLGRSGHGSHADKLRAAYSVAPSPSPGPSIAAFPTVLASPSPIAAVVHSVPAPVVTVTPVVVASVLPAPAPTSTIATSPAGSTEEGFSADDPLNSGVKLKNNEIKQKIIFRAIESAWIRYQVDNKPVTQFVFRAGKVLVLRARESIRFQVSPPKAVVYSYRGAGSKPILGDQHLVSRHNDATLFFPFELADSIQEPFPGQKALSARAVPAPRPTPSLSPPNP